MSDLHDEVLLLDGDLVRFGHVRALLQLGAGLDCHLVVPDHHPSGIEPRLAGAQVVFPAVPGAPHDFARSTVDELADARGAQEAERITGAQRSALVGTPIQQREEVAADVEHADGPAGDVDDLALAGWDLIDGADHPLGHALAPPASERGSPASLRSLHAIRSRSGHRSLPTLHVRWVRLPVSLRSFRPI